jgi:hypothetical protein
MLIVMVDKDQTIRKTLAGVEQHSTDLIQSLKELDESNTEKLKIIFSEFCATRCAIRSRACIVLPPLGQDDMINQHARCNDNVRIKRLTAKLINLDKHTVGGHRNHRIEIAPRPLVDQVAEGISTMCFEQGKIGSQRELQQIVTPVDSHACFARFDRRTDAGRCEYAAESATTTTDALDERALGNQFHRQIAVQHAFAGVWIGADMGNHHAADLPILDQRANTRIGECGIVTDQGEFSHPTLS